MEGKPFLLGEICLNLTSYQKLARHYKEYIDTSMRNIEEKLNPTVTEDEELVRRATFFVRKALLILIGQLKPNATSIPISKILISYLSSCSS
mgnify:CR=1 FL=1